MSWQFYVETQPHLRFRERLHILRKTQDSFAVVQRLEMQVFDAGDCAVSEGLCALQGHHNEVRDFLQAALDAAWEMGLRPKVFADHTNELTAVRAHLSDMRKLAKVPGA